MQVPPTENQRSFQKEHSFRRGTVEESPRSNRTSMLGFTRSSDPLLVQDIEGEFGIPPFLEEITTSGQISMQPEEENTTQGIGESDKPLKRRTTSVRQLSRQSSHVAVSSSSSNGNQDLPNSRVLRIIEAESDYEAQDEAELTIKKGDQITVRGVPEYGWCEGEVNGKLGWFPISVNPEGFASMEVKKQKVIDTEEAPVVVESILQNKQKITDAISGKIIRRPDAEELAQRNILHGSKPSSNGQLEQLQQNINNRNRAELLTNLFTNRVSPSFSDMSESSSIEDVSIGFLSPSSEEEDLSIEEKAITLFSSKPNKAIEMLIEHGILEDSPGAIAHYLYSNSRLSKEMIGDYLGDIPQRNREVLEAFLHKLDFENDNFDQAIRRFLYAFKLPGEAQKIDRIMEAFAGKYVTQCKYHKDLFKSKDCIYVLAFSTIMLNTDLHNPSIKKKMSQYEFVSNNRGINEGEDLPTVFLEDLYQRIIEEEIKTKDINCYPYAMKRGFLYTTKKSGIRGKKKLVKYWYILDRESGLHCFKQEIDPQPIATFELSALRLKKRQSPTANKNDLFPLEFTYIPKNVTKPVKLTLLAGSKRLWVDWLSLFTQVLKD